MNGDPDLGKETPPSGELVGKQTTLAWIDIFFGVLIAPIKTFRLIRAQHDAGHFLIGGAILATILAFTADGFRLTPGYTPQQSVMWIPVSIVGGLTLWLSTAFTVGLIAMIFGAPIARVKSVIVSLGWASLPWLLMTPFSILAKSIGGFAHLFSMIPGLWMFALMLLAITESFSLKAWQTAALCFVVPLVFGLSQFMQLLLCLAASAG
jgi:hypothetical protein